MTQGITSSFDTQHEDLIHDAALDYYGKRLATCSSDRTIKVYDIEYDPSPAGKGPNVSGSGLGSDGNGRIDDPVRGSGAGGAGADGTMLQSASATTNTTGQVTQHRLRETLRGHDGPVWQVCWAHPKFGTVLASCSYDGRVIIWAEMQNGQWQKVKQFDHQASVNSIAWGPHEYDLSLAAGLSDGKIHVFTCLDDGTWDTKVINAHSVGCNAVSWAPAIIPGSLIDLNGIQSYQNAEGDSGPMSSNGIPGVKRLVSGGSDNCIKIWKFSANTTSQPSADASAGNPPVSSLVGIATGQWKEEYTIVDAHQDWVRDVAWAPSIGLPKSYIASCSQDKTVHIWVNNSIATGADASKTNEKGQGNPNGWTKVVLPGNFGDAVWRVSWSTIGNLLAVSCGDNKVSLWTEDLEGQWIQI